MAKHRIGIIGVGKIVRDQHLPAIRANPNFELVALANTTPVSVEGVTKSFTDYRELLALPEVDAVSICTPPDVRYNIARDAIRAGKHALLEKPPAPTTNALDVLATEAGEAGRVLFTAWHARYNAGVDEAKKRLKGETIRRLRVTWKEDVRHWHPGQDWIWAAGGFGIFDPGINAFSVVTTILPMRIFVKTALLKFPANKDAPIAADLTFGTGAENEDFSAEFDWRQTGEQTWTIEIETESGRHLFLSKGGARLEIDGTLILDEPAHEYPMLYDRFDKLLTAGTSAVEAEPFRLVADAFMLGKRVQVEDFVG